MYTRVHICQRYSYGADASAEGVQRDLLPLIEGSTISTKYGNVKSKFFLKKKSTATSRVIFFRFSSRFFVFGLLN